MLGVGATGACAAEGRGEDCARKQGGEDMRQRNSSLEARGRAQPGAQPTDRRALPATDAVAASSPASPTCASARPLPGCPAATAPPVSELHKHPRQQGKGVRQGGRGSAGVCKAFNPLSSPQHWRRVPPNMPSPQPGHLKSAHHAHPGVAGRTDKRKDVGVGLGHQEVVAVEHLAAGHGARRWTHACGCVWPRG